MIILNAENLIYHFRKMCFFKKKDSCLKIIDFYSLQNSFVAFFFNEKYI